MRKNTKPSAIDICPISEIVMKKKEERMKKISLKTQEIKDKIV